MSSEACFTKSLWAHDLGTEINFIDMEQFFVLSHKNLGAIVAITGANRKNCVIYLILNREQNFAHTLTNLGGFGVN